MCSLCINLTTAAAGVVTVAVVSVTRWYYARRHSFTAKSPPPVIKNVGLIHTVQKMTDGSMKDFLVEQFYKMGSVYRLPFPYLPSPLSSSFPPLAPMVVVVANATDVRSIYKDSYIHTKPALMYSAIDAMTSGPNIITVVGNQGDSWYHRRKGMNPAFAPRYIQRMKQTAAEKTTEWINNRYGSIQVENNNTESPFTFNAGDEMILLTISIICKAAFDYDITLNQSKELLYAFRMGVEEFTIKTMLNPFLKWVSSWFFPDRRLAYGEVSKLHDFATMIIASYRSNPSPTTDTVIDTIMKNKHYNNDSERISDIIMVLFAGHDTTGYTLAFALRELAMNDQQQSKLRHELSNSYDVDDTNDQVNGSKDNSHNRQHNHSNGYLKAVINETMRLNPASPLSGIKQLGEDIVSKDGYWIPKGSIVFLALCAIARDPTIYPHPNEFRPERWLSPHVTEQAKYSFFPFSLGRRNCIGQPMANAELQTVLSDLVRRFKFNVHTTGRVITQGTLRLDDCILTATPMD